jgi:phage shock protein PspC (stress-responsive transcriptional regulator)
MERVVTINLNGNPYQLDEPAFDTLRGYLSRAEAALADNPDKAEVIRDLEQAIADKCASYLSPSKSVVSAAEMAKILEEMGPVEGETIASANAGAANEPPRKRLYRIADGAQIAGVCNGIAAYFDLDANIVRLVFILGFFITGGALLLLYIIMMFLIPSAQTSEEWAAAHGIPFNAQEVIDRAKREYAQFAAPEGPPWRWRREQRRAWKRAFRERMHAWGHQSGPYAPQPAPTTPLGYFARVLAGLAAFVLSIVGAALLIAFLAALYSLLNVGAILGWAPPTDMPIWLTIVVLVIVYAAISSPLRHLRRGSYAAATGRHYYHGGDGLITLLAMLAGGALAYQFVPEFRDWLQHVPEMWRRLQLEF